MVSLWIFLIIEAVLVIWLELDLMKAKKEIAHLNDVQADDYAELWEDNDQVRDVLARYSKVLAEHETKLVDFEAHDKETHRFMVEIADSAAAQIGEMEERVHGYDRHLDMHAQQILDLYDKLSAIPVEEMQANAKKESAFFEGVQNILDYSPEAVARLNVGGVTHE